MGVRESLGRSGLSEIYQAKQHYLHTTEFQQRTAAFPAETVNEILRYGAPVGSVVEYHPRLERCMMRLETLIQESERRGRSVAAGTVVLADRLDAAVGRFQRSWHAPEGGIWLAMLWPDTLLPDFARLLPFAVGLACCETVRFLGVQAHLKWVNDIHVGGKKVAGILCTTVQGREGDRYHLLGVGLNGNNHNFPQELKARATSLSAELGRKVDLQKLLICLLAKLSWNLGLLLHEEAEFLHSRDGDGKAAAPRLLAQWARLSDTVGRRVEYGFDVENEILYEAEVQGIDELGGLQLRLADGSLCTEYSGEVIYRDKCCDAP